MVERVYFSTLPYVMSFISYLSLSSLLLVCRGVAYSLLTLSVVD